MAKRPLRWSTGLRAEQKAQGRGEGLGVGEPPAGGLPWTVVGVQEPVRIIREGAIDRAAVKQALRVRGFSLNVS